MGKSAADRLPTVQIVTSSVATGGLKDSASSTARQRHKQKRWRQLQVLLRHLKEARSADLVMLQQLRLEIQNNTNNHHHHHGVNPKEVKELEQKLAEAHQELEFLRKANAELREKVDQQKGKYHSLAEQMRLKKQKINKAIEVVDKYKTKNHNLQARLQLCTCQMNPQSTGTQSSRRHRRHSKRTKSAPSSPNISVEQQPKSVPSASRPASKETLPAVAAAPSMESRAQQLTPEKDAGTTLLSVERLSVLSPEKDVGLLPNRTTVPLATTEVILSEEEEEFDIPVPRELNLPVVPVPKKVSEKILPNVAYWDEREAQLRQAAAEKAAAERAIMEAAEKALAERAAKKGEKQLAAAETVVSETSSESLEPPPKPVVDTRTPGFFIQESPAEAWRRRKEAAALRKKDKKSGRIKVQKDPWADRFKKPPEEKKESEFLLRAKRIGHGMKEHIVEASGAVPVGPGVIVTKRGIEYYGQAALEKAEEAKRLKEEQNRREEEEWEEREMARMERERIQEEEEEAERKRQMEEERQRQTEARAKQIAEREAKEAAQRAEREAREAAERAAKEQAADEARIQAEKVAREKAEAEAAQKAAAPPAPAAAAPAPPAAAPAPPAAAPPKKKKSLFDSSSDESSDAPVVKKAPAGAAPKKKSFFDSDSDSS